MKTVTMDEFLRLKEKQGKFTGIVKMPVADNVTSIRYYKNGSLHRLNGPAVEFSDGHKEWWVKGHFIYLAGCAYSQPKIKNAQQVCIAKLNLELIDIDIVETTMPEYPFPIKLRKVLSQQGILYVPIFPGM